jgi:hypothetical protein
MITPEKFARLLLRLIAILQSKEGMNMEKKIENIIREIEEKIRRLTSSVNFGEKTAGKIEAYENAISMLRSSILS